MHSSPGLAWAGGVATGLAGAAGSLDPPSSVETHEVTAAGPCLCLQLLRAELGQHCVYVFPVKVQKCGPSALYMTLTSAPSDR